MKKIFLILTALCTGAAAFAQGTDDPALNLRRFYTQTNLGSARSQALGGAMTALGGDISNTYMNPAGLGFYNRSEFSGTFNLMGSTVETEYIGQTHERTRNPLNLGQIGAVISRPGYGSRMKRGSFGIAYNTLANFSRSYRYQGVNTKSSISNAFAELANGSGLFPEDIAADYDDFGNAEFDYGMALMGGLIYYFEDAKQYDANEIDGFPITQSGEVVERGNLGQMNFSYGANFDDKTYLGASFGLQFLNYYKRTKFDEEFSSTAQVLNSQYYDNNLSITGSGINLTLGVIQRINNSFNLGATITTPTLMWVTDNFTQYAGVNPKVNDADAVMYYTDARAALSEYNYKITSPFKASLGISAFLPQKLGVLSIEGEYAGYKGMGIKDRDYGDWSDVQSDIIKDNYRNVFNFKAGLELRKGIARLRGGVNVMASPLSNPELYNVKKSVVAASVGAGLRNSNYFVDLSYSWGQNTSDYEPYWLYNGNVNEDYYRVNVKQKQGILGITVGTFF